MVLFGDGENTTENYYYAILIVIASIFYGINVNLIKKYLSDLLSLNITSKDLDVFTEDNFWNSYKELELDELYINQFIIEESIEHMMCVQKEILALISD